MKKARQTLYLVTRKKKTNRPAKEGVGTTKKAQDTSREGGWYRTQIGRRRDISGERVSKKNRKVQPEGENETRDTLDPGRGTVKINKGWGE